MVQEVFSIFAVFIPRILPGLVLGGLMLFLLRDRPRLRIPIYILLFVLIRDAMTPLGLWSLGNEGFFWMRMHANPLFLLLFGISSGVLCALLWWLDRDNRDLIQWVRQPVLPGMMLGIAGAFVVFVPFLLFYQNIPIELRGGTVQSALLPAILVFTLLGNLLEELLFRGYVMEFLAQDRPRWQAGLWSGVIFGFFHIFLAITVTDVGYPLLVFAVWEGMIAGVIAAKYGVIPATLTHGGAVFLLAAGLI